jgi:hypothetical protein
MCPRSWTLWARHEKGVKDQEILRHLDFETPGWADIND